MEVLDTAAATGPASAGSSASTSPATEVGKLYDDSPFFEAFSTGGFLLAEEKFADVTINLKDGQLVAHRCILATRIPHFRQLLLSPKDDRPQTSAAILFLPGVDRSTMRQILSYAYAGVVAVTMEEIQHLLLTARFLGMEPLSIACCNFILKRLSAENILQIWMFARTSNVKELLDGCYLFMHEQFEQTAASPLFHLLPKTILLRLLPNDDIRVSSEESVFRAIVRWLEGGQEEDEDSEAVSADKLACLPDLLKCVRWTFTSLEFVRNTVLKYHFIRSRIECRDLLDEAVDWLVRPLQMSDRTCSFSLRMRANLRESTIFVLGRSVKAFTWTLEAYNPHLECSETLFEVTDSEFSHIFSLKGCIFLLGGCNDGRGYRQCARRFDLTTRQLMDAPRMNTFLFDFCVASTDVEIFVFGGSHEAYKYSYCQVFNLTENRWQKLPCMSIARSLAATVRLAGCFFVIGGVGKFGNSLSTVERFTPIAETHAGGGSSGATTGGNWQTMAPLLTARRKPAAAVLRGAILVASENSAEVFCPPSNPNGLGQWTVVRFAQPPRADIFLLSLDGGFLEFSTKDTQVRYLTAAQGDCDIVPAAKSSQTGSLPDKQSLPASFRQWKWRAVRPLMHVTGACSVASSCEYF